MDFKLSAALVFSCVATLNATQIWTYQNPPLIEYVSGDASLRPAGLGDHFDITVSFDIPIQPGETRTISTDTFGFDSGLLAWSDGAINGINFGNPDSLAGMASFYIDPYGVASADITGNLGDGHTFFWTAYDGGYDEVLVCSGTLDYCLNDDYENGGPSGTWSVINTPEPNTISLLMIGTVFLVRKRLRGYAQV